jgi:DNA-binding NarL/FixJ family response regulator
VIGAPGWVDVDKARQYGLTPRMQDILTHLATGHTYAQTGRSLGLAEDTIRKHVKKMLRLVNARNSLNAVAIAYDAGVLRTAVEREWRTKMGLAA